MLRLNGVLEITVPGAPKEPVFAGGCWLIEMDELNPKISRTGKKVETKIPFIVVLLSNCRKLSITDGIVSVNANS